MATPCKVWYERLCAVVGTREGGGSPDPAGLRPQTSAAAGPRGVMVEPAVPLQASGPRTTGSRGPASSRDPVCRRSDSRGRVWDGRLAERLRSMGNSATEQIGRAHV